MHLTIKRGIIIKSLAIVAAVVIAITIGVVGVMAATGYFQTVQHQATGIAAPPPPPPPPTQTYTFQLFNSDGVTPLPQPIPWGDVTVGTPKNYVVTVKNTGNQTYSVGVDLTNVPAGWTLAATPITALAPGVSANTTLTLSTTATGVVNFGTDFQATY